MSDIEANEANSGSRGRTPEQSEKIPGGTYKFNRRDMSYEEMFDEPRQAGDLFAVFRAPNGEVRVQYATMSDYGDVAVDTLSRVKRPGGVGFQPHDVMFLIGGTMLTRLHNYTGEDFVHLLDANMKQIFDLCGFADWLKLNEALFQSPAQAAIDDDDDIEGLKAQYMENTKDEGSGDVDETSGAAPVNV